MVVEICKLEAGRIGLEQADDKGFKRHGWPR